MSDQTDDVTSLVSALLDAVGVADTGMFVIADRGNGLEQWYANAPCAALFGYTPEEFRDLAVIETIVPEQRQFMIQLCTSFRDGLPVPPALELEGLHKSGAHLDLDIALGHYRIPNGVVYVLLMRDAALPQRAQLSLLEADRIALVGALASGFAHEINNPLTSVLLNLRSLRKQIANGLSEPSRTQALRCLEDLVVGSERIADSVRALQMLATRSARQDVDLAAVATSALRLAAPSLEPRAQVIRNIRKVRPVTGEESRIGQAVLAMIMFSGSGFAAEVEAATNRITVAVEERDNDVIVEVTDNGRDLTSEEVDSAFDPFFRSSARGAGVGVGLGIARSVATTLGGEVSLAPRSGGGAVVTMRLPAVSAPVSA
jgi:signal transduction histidine kinase